jgi:hypothetical protein
MVTFGSIVRSFRTTRRTRAEVTTLIPDGVEPSFPACRAGVVPLDYGIVLSVTEVGIEPTESRGSRPRRFSCLRTRPFVSVCKMAGSGVAPDGQSNEASIVTGRKSSGSATKAEHEYGKLQVPVSNRGEPALRKPVEHRDTLWVYLQWPRGDSNSHTLRLDILSVACLPVPPHGHV